MERGGVRQRSAAIFVLHEDYRLCAATLGRVYQPYCLVYLKVQIKVWARVRVTMFVMRGRQAMTHTHEWET